MAEITTTLSALRLELGDTDEANYIFNDDELTYFLDAESDDVTKAKLRGCEAAALKLARAYDIATDGQSFARSQMSKQFGILAKQLRAQGVTTSGDTSGISTVSTTKVDGYSDDIANDEVTVSSSVGRRFWGHDDDVTP